MLRLAVIGHAEHITIGRVAAIPRAGDITHVRDPRVIVGGGGGIAFFQLVRSDAALHLFTALGNDEAARFVEQQLAATRATIHAVRRSEPHTRDVVMIGPDGERTIVVVGEPLHPRADDPLPWDLLDDVDAVYFTAQDPALLVRARRARVWWSRRAGASASRPPAWRWMRSSAAGSIRARRAREATTRSRRWRW
ncbi:MAG TPA: PfkB family carbohydrate kinase [Kofleriaceae bacterium]|nr:PfkB family carbohydrate kinase [Kofleriaceae bacterium]